MDYYKFLDEFDTYNEWNRIQEKQPKYNDMWMDDSPSIAFTGSGIPGAASDDVIWFGESLLPKEEKKSDNVNSPSHYTSGKTEVIDIINYVYNRTITSTCKYGIHIFGDTIFDYITCMKLTFC